jgi:hypothetical protein
VGLGVLVDVDVFVGGGGDGVSIKVGVGLGVSVRVFVGTAVLIASSKKGVFEDVAVGKTARSPSGVTVGSLERRSMKS